MLTFESLGDNHKFILFETISQVRDTLEFVASPGKALAEAIFARNDYIHNLKNTLENDCFAEIHSRADMTDREYQTVRAIHRMAICFRRSSHHCANIVAQLQHLGNHAFLDQFDYRPMGELVLDSLRRAPRELDAIVEADALTICKNEHLLDLKYDELIERISIVVKADPEQFHDGLTAIFVVRYLERVGDELLRVGEALLSILIGERIKIREFTALRRGLRSLRGGEEDQDIEDVRYKAIWGSRSGCVIGRVSTLSTPSIFKEGPVKKVRTEKEHLEAWAAISPGLTPKIYSYFEEDGLASLLVEVLAGEPLDEVLLTADPAVRGDALETLFATVEKLWRATRVDEPSPTKYMAQILKRLPKVLAVHPNLGTAGDPDATIERIQRLEALEHGLAAPFTIFIHGDFNLNNIFYDAERRAVRYVDLYRSRRADCLQDVSVYMVSGFRIPVFDEEIRLRLYDNTKRMFAFAKAFAESAGDELFHARLALALARSFFTSTRFELNPGFARAMFERSRGLMDSLLAHADSGAPWADYVLSLEYFNLRENPEKGRGT